MEKLRLSFEKYIYSELLVFLSKHLHEKQLLRLGVGLGVGFCNYRLKNSEIFYLFVTNV